MDKCNNPDGSWFDKDGACRVCGGEIPHGPTVDCDYYGLEIQLKDCLAAQAEDVDTFLLAEVTIKAIGEWNDEFAHEIYQCAFDALEEILETHNAPPPHGQNVEE